MERQKNAKAGKLYTTGPTLHPLTAKHHHAHKDDQDFESISASLGIDIDALAMEIVGMPSPDRKR